MNPLMFLPIATQLVDALIASGRIDALAREQAIQDSIAAMHKIKYPTLAEDYETAKSKLGL